MDCARCRRLRRIFALPLLRLLHLGQRVGAMARQGVRPALAQSRFSLVRQLLARRPMHPDGALRPALALNLRLCRRALFRLDLPWLTPLEARFSHGLDCKGRAVLLADCLRRHGIPAWLCIGARADAGHAWVEFEHRGRLWAIDGNGSAPILQPRYLASWRIAQIVDRIPVGTGVSASIEEAQRPLPAHPLLRQPQQP